MHVADEAAKAADDRGQQEYLGGLGSGDGRVFPETQPDFLFVKRENGNFLVDFTLPDSAKKEVGFHQQLQGSQSHPLATGSLGCPMLEDP